MKQCQFCKANFTSENAYQIHLGIGAPAFHSCNNATEMAVKGMTQNLDGEWGIDESLIIHQDNWTYLKQGISKQTETTEKPYKCSYCGVSLDFPHAFFFDNLTYCSEHLPEYDKHQQW